MIKLKSKLIAGIVCFVFIALIPGIVMADDYTLALSTYVPTEAAANATADIAGNIKIDMIVLTNAGPHNQTITIYDLATSSLTARTRFVINIPSNTVINASTITGFPYHNPMVITNMAIRKSSVNSTVNAYILYR